MFRENQDKVEIIINTGDPESSHRLNGTQRLRECCFIVGFLAAILLAVALYSFDPADPSWSQTAWGGTVQNAGGRIGAWTADSLFFIFGSLAYPLPLIVAGAAWIFFRKRGEDEPLDFMLWGTRFLGLVILLLTGCGLADLNFDDIWYFSSGGVVGDVLTSLALPYLNLLGSIIVFLFLWGAGFTLLTGISWLTIVEWIGNGALRLSAWILNKIRGSEKETLEPARESITEEPVIDESATSPVVSEWPEDDTEKSTPAQAQTEAEHLQALEHNTHRYNIHMPEAIGDFQQWEETQYSGQEEPSERTRQLHATIEELERSALEDGDMPYAPVTEPETGSSVGSLLSATDADIDPQPVLSSSVLDQIADDDPALQNEPVISDISVVEPDEPVSDIQAATTGDPDVEAFRSMVSDAQKNMAGAQNPFLMKREEDLPVPTAPLPTLELLYHPEKRENHIDRAALEEIARLVEAKLADYKIKARVVDIFPGPVITRFELDLAPGVKVSRISSLSMDLARSLSAMAVRVVEVIPGKPYVGLELPNMSRQTVYFSDVVGSPLFQQAKSPTTVVMGQDIAGEAVIADIAKMPHVLVAGTTGSGKSVGVNVMILSMLYKAKPEDLRFIMIDPKMLELSVYEGIPHLLSEVVTDMKDASNALRWCVGEMERRYKLMSVLGVRNLKGFNEKLKMAAAAGHPIHDPLWQPGDSMDQEPPLLEKLPYIVVVVDEFADLMMVVGKKVEELIARLAQKARAAGIHLILATQRPSVDVITGLIKANIPTRVAFTVSTKTDSRTILDQGGAESLLGMGDMLYLPPGSSHTVRVHGAFASDDDVHAVVNDWKARGKPQYIEDIISGDQTPDSLLPGEQMEGDDEIDPLFDQVVEFVVESRRASVSGVQRRFKVGYNRASRIVEQMEAQGIVTAPGHNGNREVLAPKPARD
ncbi:cell division protein FtsK [Vibrio sp. HA2012]|uniref:DNA translocase FtsK n=1 Tax=Vibrio sp. HA2012 TaxID=1971595 RepID=UPI000C2BAD61|nr:DNA translocase FtsK 4TM domain-containing protein [Vibrio sp. HA2012]PJC87640.1 cell division protein FtsK [Vibrio sp. HA2012]